MTVPKVSVLVATYNAGSYLRPSIESLLHQTYQNLEILVIDDGSDDGSIDSIAGLPDERIRIIRQGHSGRSRALNRALKEMKGEFYATHDADDLSDDHRIERQVACLLANAELGAVFCGNELILEGRHVAPRFRLKDIAECRRNIEKMRMPAHDTTAMYRVSMVRDLTYDEGLPFVEAYDYILRAGERVPMMVIGECLYSYRVHFKSITHRDPRARMRFVREVWRRTSERRGTKLPDGAAEQGETRRLTNRDRDNNLAGYFIESVLDQRRARSRWGAIRSGWACSCLHPLEPHYHKAIVYALVPMFLIRQLRRSRS